MSNQEVFDKVAQLIANRFSVDVETVTEGMTFQQDLGADSLDVVELVMELEDEFGVQISDEKKKGKREKKNPRCFFVLLLETLIECEY